MSINLSKYYKKAILYPSISSILVTTIYSVIDNYDYKSEWLTADFVIFTLIIGAFLYCVIMGLFALTIFLNKFDKIKKSKILNFLSWFLLPFGFIIVVFVLEINVEKKYDEKFSSEFFYVLILNLPFIIGLPWSYHKFKKANYCQHVQLK